MPAQSPYQKPQEYVDPKKFNLRTHKFNARGHLVSRSLYRLHIKDGTKYFERPVNSGNLWYEDASPAGRVELVLDEKLKRKIKKFDFEAPHTEYKAPLAGGEVLEAEITQLKSSNAQILAELEAIRAEKDKLAALIAAQDAAAKQAPSQKVPAPQAPAPAVSLAKAPPPKSNLEDAL